VQTGRDLPKGISPAGRTDGSKRLQVFSGFEPDGFSGRNIHFRTCAWIPADAGFSRLYREDTEASQFDAIVGLQSILHAAENGIDRLLGFGFADAGAFDDLIDKIQFDHWQPPASLYWPT